MDFLVLNTVASQLRDNPSLVREIERIVPDSVRVVLTSNDRSTQNLLNGLGTLGVHRVYVVGGGGTFRTVLNWLMAQPTDERPTLVPLGGGNDCLMTTHVGFSSIDPLQNIKLLFEDKVEIQEFFWRPLKVEILEEESVLYCTVFGSGLLHGFFRWIKLGHHKSRLPIFGQILKVAFLAFAVGKDSDGVLSQTFGDVQIDSGSIPSRSYLGLLASAVPQLPLKARPFRGKIHDGQFGSVAYWGTYRTLSLIWPFVWFGLVPPFTLGQLISKPSSRIIITTDDNHYSVDGGPVTVNCKVALINGGVVTFVITSGDSIMLAGPK